MPELPEVQHYKIYFDTAAMGKTIERVDVHDDKIIRNMSGRSFADSLAGRTITGSRRRGKYLFAALDNGHHVLLHFGMNGDLNYYTTPEDKGRFECFVFRFTDGDSLGFDDSRKFARVLYLEDREAYIEEIGLGPDALRVDETYLLSAMEGKKGSLKGFLLNQSILAGVGNLYADEICYRASIHPARPLNKINETEKREVIRHLLEVMTKAAERAPHYRDYPPDWFWHVWREEGKQLPDGEVVVTKVAGRTTYFVEGRQQ